MPAIPTAHAASRVAAEATRNEIASFFTNRVSNTTPLLAVVALDANGVRLLSDDGHKVSPNKPPAAYFDRIGQTCRPILALFPQLPTPSSIVYLRIAYNDVSIFITNVDDAYRYYVVAIMQSSAVPADALLNRELAEYVSAFRSDWVRPAW